MTKRNQSRANRCDRCGSSNWQGVKIAFNQSVRRTTGGYESVSRFGESIAPPPKRSLFSGPLFSATGLSCGTLLFLPAIRENDLSSAFLPARTPIKPGRWPATAARAGCSPPAVQWYGSANGAAPVGPWSRHHHCRQPEPALD